MRRAPRLPSHAAGAVQLSMLSAGVPHLPLLAQAASLDSSRDPSLAGFGPDRAGHAQPKRDRQPGTGAQAGQFTGPTARGPGSWPAGAVAAAAPLPLRSLSPADLSIRTEPGPKRGGAGVPPCPVSYPALSGREHFFEAASYAPEGWETRDWPWDRSESKSQGRRG